MYIVILLGLNLMNCNVRLVQERTHDASCSFGAQLLLWLAACLGSAASNARYESLYNSPGCTRKAKVYVYTYVLLLLAAVDD